MHTAYKRAARVAGTVALLAAGVAFAACAADSPLDPDTDEVSSGSRTDAGLDAGRDAGAVGSKDASSTAHAQAMGATIDAEPDTGFDSGADTGVDSGVDSGPPPPAPGGACAPIGLLATLKCGACGTRDTVCEPGNIWSAFGPCVGQIPGGCIPGATRTVACGNCGKRTDSCTPSCAWTTGACGGEVLDGCSAGETRYIAASCTDPETYRAQVCDTATCYYGAAGPLPCEPLPADVLVAGTLSAVVTADASLASSTPAQIGRPTSASGLCPLSVSSSPTFYRYLVIRNPNPQAAVIDVWADKQDPADPDVDAVMAIYPPPIPKTVAQRQACLGTYSTVCNVAPCRAGQPYWPGLANAEAPTIAAGGTLVVYVTVIPATLPDAGAATGRFRLSVRTRVLL